MPVLFVASTGLDAIEFIVLFIVAGVLVLPTFMLVHWAVQNSYLAYARRFCRKNGFDLARWRCRPEFDNTGVKTEFTLFEIDCVDVHGERKLIRLRIWIFGVHKVLRNEKYPESDDGDVQLHDPD